MSRALDGALRDGGRSRRPCGRTQLATRRISPSERGDVLTDHHPLIGTAASAASARTCSPTTPDRCCSISPPSLCGCSVPGREAVAVAAINVAAGALAIVFGGRRLGAPGTVLVTAMFVLLAFVAGSELLFDPYNPTVSMFPFLACLVLTWAAADGDRAAPAWLIGTATFCLQTNLAYVIVTVPLVMLGLAWFVAGAARGIATLGGTVSRRVPATSGALQRGRVPGPLAPALRRADPPWRRRQPRQTGAGDACG